MKQKLKILIVEDEGIQALALEETLEREGYTIAGISDHGLEALEIIKSKQVDLIILDVNIKGRMDGIETAKQIQAIKQIPFIYLTAYMDDRTQERAELTKPVAYLNKPYKESRLLTAVESAVSAIREQQNNPTEK